MVLLGWILGSKPSQPEPQLQPYHIMKWCRQVSKYNGFRSSFDKTYKKLHILRDIWLKWHGRGTTTHKQCKRGQRNTFYCAKYSCLLSHRPYLDVKEVEILSESEYPPRKLFALCIYLFIYLFTYLFISMTFRLANTSLTSCRVFEMWNVWDM